MKKTLIAFFFAVGLLTACTSKEKKTDDTTKDKTEEKVVYVYSERHYDADKKLYEAFQKETGIEVKVKKAKGKELMKQLLDEGADSPADVLVTVDAGNLYSAKSKGLFQPISNIESVAKNVPAHLRDSENHWIGLTKRARVIVYNPEKTKKEDLSTYEDLTSDKWKSKILIRSSGNIYNQSLMASVIANLGEEKAKEWAAGIVANMARKPNGNDRDQVKAIIKGEGELAIVNTYYIGKLVNSSDETEKEVGSKVAIFFPNQETTGTHVNVSGIGITKNAPHKENAMKLIEFLTSKKAQEEYAKANYEYPVNPEAEISELLKSWGQFKADEVSMNKLGENNKKAMMIMDEVSWQ